MATQWTSQQILALAPDASSAKSGQELANPRKWATVGATEQALWGECQGSGSKPYQVQIALQEPAFKCSCPSRKFPCKHGLGLFLLFAQSPSPVPAAEPPAWVAEWLAGREQKAEKRAQKADDLKPSAGDPAAQSKRHAQRESKITAGLSDLKRWLHDHVRQGIADLPARPKSLWEAPAARLVDAQAPGVARMVRDLASVAASGQDWQERLLLGLAKINLLVEGWERRDNLPPLTVADLRTALGWPIGQDEVLADQGVRDRWTVAGQYSVDEDRLRVQRTWLLGETTGRSALILQFAHGVQPFDTDLVPGTVLEAELAYFPSAAPQRALIKTRLSKPQPQNALAAAPIDAMRAACAAQRAANPWLERFPAPLQQVIVFHRDSAWRVRDQTGDILPLSPHYEPIWQLMAITGGQPVDLFGEWDGRTLRPLAVVTEGRLETATF